MVVAIILFGVAASAWYVTRAQAVPAGGRGARSGGGPTTVTLVMPRKQDVAIELEAHGTVVPLSTVELRPQTSNILKRVHIKEGQFVRTGEVLFTLDDRSDRANLDKVQAQLVRDQTTLVDLELQSRRSHELALEKFISQGAAESLQAQAESQRALVQADRAALQSAQLALDYATLRAPMAGRIGAINVFPGSLVQPALALASVTRMDPIAVSFTVPESSLHGLLMGQKDNSLVVRATLPNLAAPLKGSLSFIDSSVDPVAGTLRVKAQFDNRAGLLWPGQYVNAAVTVGTLKDAVVVPMAAIVTGADGSFVYSMERDKTAKVRPIGLIYAFGRLAAVSGLSGDEQIIVDGKQNLRAGSKVQEAQVADAGGGQRKRRAAHDGPEGAL